MAMTWNIGLANAFTFRDFLSTNITVVSLTDTIAFTETFTGKTNRYRPSLSDTLVFQEYVIPSGQVIHRSLTDSINLTQNVRRVFAINIVDSIAFSDVNERLRVLENTLTFVETFRYDYGKLIYDNSLVFTQNVSVNILHGITPITDTIVFQSHVKAYVVPYVIYYVP